MMLLKIIFCNSKPITFSVLAPCYEKLAEVENLKEYLNLCYILNVSS